MKKVRGESGKIEWMYRGTDKIGIIHKRLVRDREDKEGVTSPIYNVLPALLAIGGNLL